MLDEYFTLEQLTLKSLENGSMVHELNIEWYRTLSLSQQARELQQTKRKLRNEICFVPS